jgi:DGQHR domain-containing protein
MAKKRMPPKSKAPSAISKRRRKKKGRKHKVLTPQELEQNLQKKEIRNLMENIGFSRAPHVEGKEFIYDGRTSELDDVFLYENLVVFTEYTIGSPGIHLLKKKIIYDKINNNPRDFIKFIITEPKFKQFTDILKKTCLKNYTINQLQIRILYASKSALNKEHKDNVDNVHYFDYSIVKYFESISRIIKKSTRFEFFDFLNIDFSKIGANVKSSSINSVDDFSGHILPEEHSSFKEGYKLVSFYMDADSLLKRAFVLRKDGWRNKDNIGLYQRMVLKKKIKSMRKYLHDKSRVFVNNIIVTLPIDKLKLFDADDNELKIDKYGNFKSGGVTHITPATIQIQNKSNIIGIIDGQHRSYAYHEGDDIYESKIAKLRGIQNLLVTGILYPKDEEEDKRLKFEAELFLEINATQSGATSPLKQAIEFMLTPFSTTSIAKNIINKLNESGPLGTFFEEYWYEKAKLKTSSIVSFGLKPLIKFEGNDTLFKIWSHASKSKLKTGKDFTALRTYKDFCAEEIRNVFIGIKANIPPQNWKMDRTDPNAMLNVTTVNGIINCLRILVEKDENGDVDFYKKQFTNVNTFKFKAFKSSQYRKLGQELYNHCFNQK